MFGEYTPVRIAGKPREEVNTLSSINSHRELRQGILTPWNCVLGCLPNRF
jgi:hypothetical protein